MNLLMNHAHTTHVFTMGVTYKLNTHCHTFVHSSSQLSVKQCLLRMHLVGERPWWIWQHSSGMLSIDALVVRVWKVVMFTWQIILWMVENFRNFSAIHVLIISWRLRYCMTWLVFSCSGWHKNTCDCLFQKSTLQPEWISHTPNEPP